MWLYSQPCSFACFLEDTQSQKPEKSVSQRNIEIFLELITFQLLKVDFSVAQENLRSIKSLQRVLFRVFLSVSVTQFSSYKIWLYPAAW